MSKLGRNQKCPCGSGLKYKRCCGSRKTTAPAKVARIEVPVDPERIHEAIVDHERELAIFVTNDVVTNTLNRDLPKIAEGFDQICADHIQQLNEVTARLFARFAEIHTRAPIHESQLFRTFWLLLHNATNTAFAQLHLVRSGFRLQPGSLARGVVEILSVVCHLAICPDDLSKFQEHKLSSTKTIASGKKVLPPLGMIYGQLSNNFVHVGHHHCGINPLQPYDRDDTALDLNLMHVKMCFWLILVITELAFFPWLSNARYWASEVQGCYSYGPDASEQEWMREFLNGTLPHEGTA